MKILLLTLSALAVFGIAGAQAAEAVKVTDYWIKEAPMGSKVAAGFVTLESPVDGKLVGVSSPDAGTVEIHTMAVEKGIVSMRPVADGLALPQGKPVVMKPQGLHLMFIDLNKSFRSGDTIPVTLTFDDASSQTVQMPIRSEGQSAHEDHRH